MLIPQEGPGGPSRHNGGTRPGGLEAGGAAGDGFAASNLFLTK